MLDIDIIYIYICFIRYSFQEPRGNTSSSCDLSTLLQGSY